MPGFFDEMTQENVGTLPFRKKSCTGNEYAADNSYEILTRSLMLYACSGGSCMFQT
jgi:hypothetical protein